MWWMSTAALTRRNETSSVSVHISLCFRSSLPDRSFAMVMSERRCTNARCPLPSGTLAFGVFLSVLPRRPCLPILLVRWQRFRQTIPLRRFCCTGLQRLPTRSRFIMIFPDTAIWRLGWDRSSAFLFRKISAIPTSPAVSPSFGDAGISRWAVGSGNMSTFLLVAAASEKRAYSAICSLSGL